jgi:sulfur carrier protein
MKLRINGDDRDIADFENIADLIGALGLPDRATLVEHNGLALRRDEWRERTLAEGDRLEIIRIVAGG